MNITTGEVDLRFYKPKTDETPERQVTIPVGSSRLVIYFEQEESYIRVYNLHGTDFTDKIIEQMNMNVKSNESPRATALNLDMMLYYLFGREEA